MLTDNVKLQTKRSLKKLKSDVAGATDVLDLPELLFIRDTLNSLADNLTAMWASLLNYNLFHSNELTSLSLTSSVWAFIENNDKDREFISLKYYWSANTPVNISRIKTAPYIKQFLAKYLEKHGADVWDFFFGVGALIGALQESGSFCEVLREDDLLLEIKVTIPNISGYWYMLIDLNVASADISDLKTVLNNVN